MVNPSLSFWLRLLFPDSFSKIDAEAREPKARLSLALS
jgi:hypothetical protein